VDPDKLWSDIVSMADAIESKGDDSIALELAEAVLDLQDWLDNGGFPPEAFTQQPK